VKPYFYSENRGVCSGVIDYLIEIRKKEIEYDGF